MTRATMASLLVGLMGVVACGPGDRDRDAGGGGIDANLTPNDARAMACTTEGAENTVEACSDSCDNDGDSFADCDDFDCCSLVSCGADTSCGRRGDAGATVDAALVTCPTTGPENTAAACSDGCDNDGDRFVDCNDFDCCSHVSCGPTTSCGRADAGATADAAVVTCATTGPENTVEACSDGCDNDSDRFVDCNDFDCCGRVTCGASTTCGRLDAGMRADSGPRCDAGAGAATEEGATACADGIDNDCDGFIDCRDFGCTTMAPAERTYCIENNATLCNDSADNDADGFIDCQDRDCCGIRTRESCAAGSYIGDGRCPT